ncbi:RNA polymerase sigma factor SigX [Desulfotomaculum sp. 1211_IL3151]|uniref:RNA polymerase sigma factor SigX n=1 Tax=Desulfotomaculum sp. 1211_IL3151 TaxID=3084055 RepID=UPI002FDB407F
MTDQLQKLYEEMYPKLVRQAAFMLGDVGAAEDAAQEAFLRLYRQGLDEIENPSAWLTKVTNNLCYSHLRSEGNRRRREEKVGQAEEAVGFSLVVPSAEQLVVDREELQLIRQALAELKPRDRMVLLMKFSGYNYEEIAATLDVSKGSVGTFLARARERFRQAYQRFLLTN